MRTYFTILLCITLWLSGSDLTSGVPRIYVARDTIQLSLHRMNWNDASATRKQLNLNGEWLAAFGNTEEWQTVTVPGASTYKGKIAFRRTFTPDSSYRDLQFRFVALGINYSCQIYINQKFIGEHRGGFTSFNLDIEAGIIRLGESNEILIQVDTRLGARSTLPVNHVPMGPTHYGGILRDVFLLALPIITIDDVKISSRLASQNELAILDISVDIRKSAIMRELETQFSTFDIKKLSYRIDVWSDRKKRPVLQSGRESISMESATIQSVSFSGELEEPLVWSPDAPHLYRLKIVLYQGRSILDEVDYHFGIRNIAIQEHAIFLNHERYFLNGVNWHEYAQLANGLPSFEAIKQRVMVIKELGANFVRVVGQPPHPYLADMCSQYGLFLFTELPVAAIPGPILRREEIRTLARLSMREMVARDRHQASIIAWGVGSGLDPRHPGTGIYISEISQLVNELDNRFSYAVLSRPHQSVFDWPIDVCFFEMLNAEPSQLDSFANINTNSNGSRLA